MTPKVFTKGGLFGITDSDTKTVLVDAKYIQIQKDSQEPHKFDCYIEGTYQDVYIIGKTKVNKLNCFAGLQSYTKNYIVNIFACLDRQNKNEMILYFFDADYDNYYQIDHINPGSTNLLSNGSFDFIEFNGMDGSKNLYNPKDKFYIFKDEKVYNRFQFFLNTGFKDTTKKKLIEEGDSELCKTIMAFTMGTNGAIVPGSSINLFLDDKPLLPNNIVTAVIFTRISGSGFGLNVSLANFMNENKKFLIYVVDTQTRCGLFDLTKRDFVFRCEENYKDFSFNVFENKGDPVFYIEATKQNNKVKLFDFDGKPFIDEEFDGLTYTSSRDFAVVRKGNESIFYDVNKNIILTEKNVVMIQKQKGEVSQNFLYFLIKSNDSLKIINHKCEELPTEDILNKTYIFSKEVFLFLDNKTLAPLLYSYKDGEIKRVGNITANSFSDLKFDFGVQSLVRFFVEGMFEDEEVVRILLKNIVSLNYDRESIVKVLTALFQNNLLSDAFKKEIMSYFKIRLKADEQKTDIVFYFGKVKDKDKLREYAEDGRVLLSKLFNVWSK